MSFKRPGRGTRHCNLVVLIRNRIIDAYFVVVILSAPSRLSGILCCHGYKSARVRRAPLWGGALEAGPQHSREEKGGTWELYHSNLLAKFTPAALTEMIDGMIGTR